MGDIAFIQPSDGEWTVSAAALYFLRTVSSDHTKEDSVTETNYLIPCCGFSVVPDVESKYGFVIIGCPSGIDLTLTHSGADVTISFGDKEATVSKGQWAKAVLTFSDHVQDFYSLSDTKEAIEDDHDRLGWERFWNEWREQREIVARHVDAT